MNFKNFEQMAILTIWESFEEGGETIIARFICENWDKADKLGYILTDEDKLYEKNTFYTIDDHFENIEDMIQYYND